MFSEYSPTLISMSPPRKKKEPPDPWPYVPPSSDFASACVSLQLSSYLHAPSLPFFWSKFASAQASLCSAPFPCSWFGIHYRTGVVVGLNLLASSLSGGFPSSHPSIAVVVSSIGTSASPSPPSVVGPQVSCSFSPSLPSFFRFRHPSCSGNFRFVIYPSHCGYWNLKLLTTWGYSFLRSVISLLNFQLAASHFSLSGHFRFMLYPSPCGHRNFNLRKPIVVTEYVDCLPWDYSFILSEIPLINSAYAKAFLTCPLLKFVDIFSRSFAKPWIVAKNYVSQGFFVIAWESLSTLPIFGMKLLLAFSTCSIFSCYKLMLLFIHVLSLSMVRGHKVSLWPKTSPLANPFALLVSCMSTLKHHLWPWGTFVVDLYLWSPFLDLQSIGLLWQFGLLCKVILCIMLSCVSIQNAISPVYVCFMPLAVYYYFGVWFLASGVHNLFCWFGVPSMLVGLHLGLCVAGLMTFWQPQHSMAAPVVYDVDGAFPGISETDVSFCFLPAVWIVLYGNVILSFNASDPWIWVHLHWELPMVSGHEDSFLWPKTSLLNSLCYFDTVLAKCIGFPLDIEMVFCCRCSVCWAVLQGLKCCWYLFHLWSWPPLVTIFRNSWWLYLPHPWLGFSLQLRHWLLEDAARLYPTLIFRELYFHSVVEILVVTSPLHHMSFPLVELKHVFFGHHMLKWAIPFCNLPLLSQECNVVVFLWNKLDCNNRSCIFFRNRRDGLYVIGRIIPALVPFLHRVLSTAGKRYDMPLYFLLWSPSMVRGHKAQVLWPVASPLTIFSGQYYRCIVKNMVWTTLLLLWYGCHGLLKLFPCGWYLCSCLFLLNLPARNRMELRPVKDSLNDAPLQNMGLHDSIELFNTMSGQFPPILYL